jgi:hypothetical protein
MDGSLRFRGLSLLSANFLATRIRIGQKRATKIDKPSRLFGGVKPPEVHAAT